MKTLNDFLDNAKNVTGSDYKTAQKLNLSRSAICKARKTGSIDADNAVELAKIIEVNPAEIIAACNVAKHPENAPFWLKFAATACLALVMMVPQHSEAKSIAYENQKAALYILC